jgi:glycerate kinase
VLVKVLLCPQEFKSSLTAREACSAMAKGAARLVPPWEIDELPLSDGGSGLVDALVTARRGAFHTVIASDPLGRPIRASFGLIDAGHTAVIELAAASGLSLVNRDELDPLHASTFGTGEIIRAALDLGIRSFIVGIGGSATNDGGAGMVEALGAKLLGDDLQPIGRGGAALAGLAEIDVQRLDNRILQSSITVASDVRNPLCGPEGASAIYGPQKGADADMIALLDGALRRYADVIAREFGRDVGELPGAGAAGGAGAGLMAFLHARLVPGFSLVAEATRLDQRLAGADLAITGEGRLDAQTGFGKVVGGVAERAASAGVPVIAIAGGLETGSERVPLPGITAAFSLQPGPRTLEEAMENAADYLADRTEAVLRTVACGIELARRTSERD